MYCNMPMNYILRMELQEAKKVAEQKKREKMEDKLARSVQYFSYIHVCVYC